MSVAPRLSPWTRFRRALGEACTSWAEYARRIEEGDTVFVTIEGDSLRPDMTALGRADYSCRMIEELDTWE